MKKLLLFIAGISILFLAGCYNGNQSHGNEIMGFSFQPGDACMVSTFRLKRKDDGPLYNNRWSSEVLARARHSTLP